MVTASGARSFVVSVWVRLSPCRRPHASGPAPKSGQLASRRDLCRAVPSPARAFLWIASRPSCGECRNRAGLAGLCHRSICSSSQIAKRRIRTSASVMRRHRKRPGHQWRRARSRGLRPRKWRRRASATSRHRKQSSRQCRRAHPSHPRPRESRPRRGRITVVSAKSEFGEHPGTCHNPPNATGGDQPTNAAACRLVRVSMGTRSQGAFRVK